MTTKPTGWVIVRDQIIVPTAKEYYTAARSMWWTTDKADAKVFDSERVAREVNDAMGLGGRVEPVEGKS